MVGEVSHLGGHLETICVRILNMSRSRNDRVIGMERGGGVEFFFVLSTFPESRNM